MECWVGNFGKGLANETLGGRSYWVEDYFSILRKNDDPGGRVVYSSKV